MRKVRFLGSALLVLALSVSALAQGQKAGDSLYKRLGGYDALAAVTDDFIGRLVTNPQTSKFFTGFSDDSKKRIRQLVIDFLCQASGGPCVYNGRDMKTAHAGSGITEADWDDSVKDLVATLNKFKVPEKEKGEVLTLASSLKADIVDAKKK